MLLLSPPLVPPLLALTLALKFPWLLKLVRLVPLQRLPVAPAMLLFVALMLLELLLGLLGFVPAGREGGVNEKTLSAPLPAVRALKGPGWLSADGKGSRVRQGGGGRRDRRPCPRLSLDIGQSAGGRSGKEKAGVLGTSPSSLSQGKADDGIGGMWFGVSGGSICEPTIGGARELQLRSHSF